MIWTLRWPVASYTKYPNGCSPYGLSTLPSFDVSSKRTRRHVPIRLGSPAAIAGLVRLSALAGVEIAGKAINAAKMSARKTMSFPQSCYETRGLGWAKWLMSAMGRKRSHPLWVESGHSLS